MRNGREGNKRSAFQSSDPSQTHERQLMDKSKDSEFSDVKQDFYRMTKHVHPYLHAKTVRMATGDSQPSMEDSWLQ